MSVYVNEKFKSRKITHLSRIFPHFETCVVEIFLTKNFSFFLVGLYRPPNPNLSDFFNALNTLINTEFTNNSNVFFIGDFNIDISNFSLPGQELFHNFVNYDFFSLIDEPTRISNSERIINHIWTNIFQNYKSFVIQSDISDHFIIGTSFKMLSPLQKQKKIFQEPFSICSTKFCIKI